VRTAMWLGASPEHQKGVGAARYPAGGEGNHELMKSQSMAAIPQMKSSTNGAWGAVPPVPMPMPPQQQPFRESDADSLDGGVCETPLSQKFASSVDGEDHIVNGTLQEREATVLRIEGEKVLLAQQAQQMEQQMHDATKDAMVAYSQLAQALQFLEVGTGMRLPSKQDADRARALISGSRRILRRIIGIKGASVDDPKGNNSVETTSTGTMTAAARAAQRGPGGPNGSQQPRRSPPRGRPRSPRGAMSTTSTQNRASCEAVGLAASAAAAVGDFDGKATWPTSHGLDAAMREARRPAKVHDVRSPRPVGKELRSNRRNPISTSTATLSGAGSGCGAGSTPAGSAAHTPGVAHTPVSATKQQPGEDDVQDVGGLDPRRASESRPPATGSRSGTKDSTALLAVESREVQTEAPPPQPDLSKEFASLQVQFTRQRELLVVALKKSASIETTSSTLKDDVTRRDVVIHGLRQEVQTLQQELQVQQQHFEQEAAQEKQNHQLQQLQHLQQFQDLQNLLQQQQASQQRAPLHQTSQQQAVVVVPQKEAEAVEVVYEASPSNAHPLQVDGAYAAPISAPKLLVSPPQ